MSKYHFKDKDEERFDVHEAMKGISCAYESKTYNLCTIILDGKHGPVRNKTITETFYILEGEIAFNIGDEHFTATKGDVVTCPNMVWRELNGKGTFLAICNPPYFEEDQEFKV